MQKVVVGWGKMDKHSSVGCGGCLIGYAKVNSSLSRKLENKLYGNRVTQARDASAHVTRQRNSIDIRDSVLSIIYGKSSGDPGMRLPQPC